VTLNRESEEISSEKFFATMLVELLTRPILKGSTSPPVKEKAPINTKGKKRLKIIDWRSLKKIFKKTFAK
jgi:hypothetical protein